MPHYERFKHRPRERLLPRGSHEHFIRENRFFARTQKKKGPDNSALIRNIVIIALIIGGIYLLKNGGKEKIAAFFHKSSAPAAMLKKADTETDERTKRMSAALKKFFSDAPVTAQPERKLEVVTKKNEREVVRRETVTVPHERTRTNERTVTARHERAAAATAVESPSREAFHRAEDAVVSKSETKPERAERTERTVARAVRTETEPTLKNPDIYFIKYDEEKGSIELTPRKRTLGDHVELKDAINALLEGPHAKEKDENVITCIPEQAHLNDVKREGDTVYLDFNSAFEFNPLGREGLKAQLYQIIYTATEYPGVKQVVILINGKRRDSIGGEGFAVNKPFTRPGKRSFSVQ